MTAFKPFSPKQMQALTWWCPGSPHSGKSGIICDGAVRSGKTLCMSLSFVSWAFYRFRDTAFALCGKTVASLRRNVLTPLTEQLTALGFTCTFKISRSELTVRRDGRENRFYLFGGRDESSAALIQGMTLGGVLLDEVALMPRSFVEQALARCSLEGATYWFNCNPEHPYHWFYKEWIQKAAEKQVLYLHFQMTDNPSLSPAVLRRYKRLYSGTFYRRFVEGRWVAADGLVYPMFDPKRHVGAPGQRLSGPGISLATTARSIPFPWGCGAETEMPGAGWRSITTPVEPPGCSLLMRNTMPTCANWRGIGPLRR